MSWLKWILSLFVKERAEAEKKTNELFRAQLREALLRQDDLREAAQQMKKISESAPSSTPYRAALSSRPL